MIIGRERALEHTLRVHESFVADEAEARLPMLLAIGAWSVLDVLGPDETIRVAVDGGVHKSGGRTSAAV